MKPGRPTTHQGKTKRKQHAFLAPVPAASGESKDRTADDYDLIRQVGHLLRKAYQTHLAIFQSLNNHPSVTPTQFAVLCAVRDCGPCSLTVIGRRIVMDLATVRGIMERLAKRGLVSMSRGDSDRRQVIATLEPKGRKILTEMLPVAQEISEVTTQDLSVAEKVALTYLLEKLSATRIAPEEADSAVDLDS